MIIKRHHVVTDDSLLCALQETGIIFNEGLSNFLFCSNWNIFCITTIHSYLSEKYVQIVHLFIGWKRNRTYTSREQLYSQVSAACSKFINHWFPLLYEILIILNLWAHYLTNTRSSKTRQYTFSETGLNFFLIDWSLLSNKLTIKDSSNFGMQKKKNRRKIQVIWHRMK